MAIGDIPRKIVIDGRLQFGKQFIKEATNQLSILEHQMSYRSLAIGERTVKFNDDVHFICNVTHKQRTIVIITDPWTRKRIPQPYRECPKTHDLAFGFIDKLHGMVFNLDGDPVVFPAQMYTSRSPTWDIFVCEGTSPYMRYSYWQSCKPFCFFVHDHSDDEDLGWVYDAGAANNPVPVDEPKIMGGRPILARPLRNEEGVIFDYRVTNIIPEGFRTWEYFQKYTTSKVLRY